METNFTQMLIEANGIEPDHFKTWIFCEGMTFNAPGKWWGDRGSRDFPHEGIDLCLYADSNGRVGRLHEHTRIPAMHDGVIKALFTDYLGQAVIVEHEGAERDNGKYLSAYAHTVPQPGITIGGKIKRGDIIATIADTRRSKAKILPHFHYSLGRPSPKLVYDPFVWNIMRDPDRINLLDPMSILHWPHQLLDAKHSFCRSI